MGRRPDSQGGKVGFAPAAPRSRRRLASALAASVLATGLLASCGGDDSTSRQDANEAAGDYPVEVTKAKFPTDQRLALTSDLEISVENTGDETVPELAFTIGTDDGDADGSFQTRIDDPSVSNPSRPVWILESKYPRAVGEPVPKGVSGGLRAQTNTFAFGPLEPGEEKTIVWRVTAVEAGTYTLHYRVEAGLDGEAKAVTDDGGEVKGEFVVTISDKAPKATVNDEGQVVTHGD
ncbi:MAG: hypothetical protein R2718_00890 [Solirubrobacterales bacterium]|nr:hypothetical protein [Solirubrobacterales bacterium]